jgi:hypothetical protein
VAACTIAAENDALCLDSLLLKKIPKTSHCLDYLTWITLLWAERIL